MMDADVFNRLGEMLLGSRSRVAKEHQDFLKLYRAIVETAPSEVCEAFGKLPNIYVTLKSGEKKDGWGILLTVSDYLFWKKSFDDGARFTKGVPAVQAYMLRHMAKQVETVALEPKERKSLLALVESA